MKSFKSTIFSLLFGFGVISTTHASPFSISENQINQYLTEKGTFEDQLSFPGLFSLNYQLKDLNTQIGRTDEKRVQISGIAEGLFKLGGKQFPAKLDLTFDTVPYYDAEKGAVYLRDLRILRWSGEPNEYMEQLQLAMPFLSKSIAALLSTIPVYTLDDSNMRNVLIKKFAKGIKIEPGSLALEAGVF